MSKATIDDIRQLLRRWDKGSRSVRESILQAVVLQCVNMTGPELDVEFCDCASLFLARLTAWLRISYMANSCLILLLKAIAVFVTSTSGQNFLTEFLEVGGMLTVLEIVGLRTSKDDVKTEAIRLLMAIANKGRQYKELLCESFGVKLVGECLALSPSQETQECARDLLHQLFTGNPHYQSQVYKALESLLSSTSSEAQRMAAYTLRLVQSSMGVTSGTIVEPALQLLKSLHVEVQHEAIELLKVLVSYEEVRQPILTGLVGKLKPNIAPSVPKVLQGVPAPLPVFIQQAGAAKAIGHLAVKNMECAEMLIELRAVSYLMHGMGNTANVESQRQCSIALAMFVNKFPSVKEQVLLIMGTKLFQQFINDPKELYLALSPSQIDVLVDSLGLDHDS